MWHALRRPPAEPVHFDISELFAHPLNTGIQRQQRAIIAHWPGRSPGTGPLLPVVYDAARDTLAVLPRQAFDLLLAAPGDDPARVHARLAPLLARATPLREAPTVLNVELFFDPRRAACHRRLCATEGSRIGWLVHDFFPWLHPEWADQGSARHAMPYLRALRAVPRVCFVSEATRSAFRQRIARDDRRDGPVIPPGAEGAAIERQSFRPARRSFLAVGTMEPRKAVATVIDAFRLLWREGLEVELILAGRMLPTARREAELLAELSGERRLRYLGAATDEQLATAFRQARATIAASGHEGYGLAPLESLAAGVPVIADAAIPSLAGIAPGGQIRLHAPDAQAIAGAVRGLLDDGAAARLWGEAAAVVVPSWGDFTARLSGWAVGDEPATSERQALAA